MVKGLDPSDLSGTVRLDPTVPQNGGNCMKQAKWILAVLTAAVLCIIGAAAMADGEEPHLALRVARETRDCAVGQS